MEFLISFFLVIFLFILLIRILIPYILPFFAKRFLKRYGINLEDNKNTQKQRREKESNVSGSGHEKIIDKDMGEYVDFEEVKD